MYCSRSVLLTYLTYYYEKVCAVALKWFWNENRLWIVCMFYYHYVLLCFINICSVTNVATRYRIICKHHEDTNLDQIYRSLQFRIQTCLASLLVIKLVTSSTANESLFSKKYMYILIYFLHFLLTEQSINIYALTMFS